MRTLLAVPNVDGATTDYPKGKVRDKSGPTAGTTGGEILFGDLVQLLQKLVIDAGITENTLPDNVANGYQLLDALNAKIKERTQVSTAITSIYSGAFNTGDPDKVITAVTYDRIIYLTVSGTISNADYLALISTTLIARQYGYGSLTFLLPAGTAATIKCDGGTATNVGILSQKLGL